MTNPSKLIELAEQALEQVKRTRMSPLARVVSLIVIDRALSKAAALRAQAAKEG